MSPSRPETDTAWVAGFARVGPEKFSKVLVHVTMVPTEGSDGTGQADSALESKMTEILDSDTIDPLDTVEIVQDPINQALEIIDRSLGTLHQRELVSAAEMSDILLDMRSLLSTDSDPTEELQDAVR